MKIAYDATVLQGKKSGVGYYCEELLGAMAALDHETEFFVFSHRPLNREGYPASPNVRVSTTNQFPVRAFYLHTLLPQLLRRERPDLCHYTNFLAPFKESTPYVVTIHDMGLERMETSHPLAKRLYTKRLIPRVAERARLVITNSEYSKWEIVRYLGIPASRIRVTPLAASAAFRPIAGPLREEVLKRFKLDKPYVLYVGNLEPRKNLKRLLQAFARLEGRDLELVIVGNRWYRGNDAEEAAKSLGIHNRVRFPGYVDREDLPALYSGALAFIYPSLLEGFGLPVIEAMACGTPVITSNNSSLKEIAVDAALLVDASSTRSIQQALEDVIRDESLRKTLAEKGILRASTYSWQATAALTLDAYREALGQVPAVKAARPLAPTELADAIQRTVDYCAMFQYPLRLEELRERLVDVPADCESLDACCRRMGLPRAGEFICIDPEFISLREVREAVSDKAIAESWRLLEKLAALPFIRMIAFSGATAHRNMSTAEDLDLFIVVEDGKLWATFLIAMIWAKWHGVRRRLCMNYVITDHALPLFDRDMFTAQQAASLKPIYGKSVYDRFIASNEFIRTHFPNFSASKPRAVYEEIGEGFLKRLLEPSLRLGPIQVLERISRRILGKYLRGKAAQFSNAEGDVILERRRLKLHMNSHRQSILAHSEKPAGRP